MSAAPPAAARRWPLHLATLGLCAAFFAVVGTNVYRQDLALLVIAYAIIALGLYLPLALCGSLSLGYNVYFGIGAYAVAVLSRVSPGAIWLAGAAAVVLSMVSAAVIALCTRRLSGFHLAVATMMFGIAAHTWLVHSDALGGPMGLGGIPRLILFGWVLGRTELIGIGVLVVWLAATAIGHLRTSLVGVAMRMQRESPLGAQACGIPTEALKVVALSLGAGIASLAGVLFALVNQFVLPDTYSIKIAFFILFMPVLGGLGTPWGSVLGALLVVSLTLGFDFFEGPGSLTFGVLTLVILLAAPEGLLGLAGALLPGQRARARAGGAS